MGQQAIIHNNDDHDDDNDDDDDDDDHDDDDDDDDEVMYQVMMLECVALHQTCIYTCGPLLQNMCLWVQSKAKSSLYPLCGITTVIHSTLWEGFSRFGWHLSIKGNKHSTLFMLCIKNRDYGLWYAHLCNVHLW